MQRLRRRAALAAAALGLLVVTAGPVHAGDALVATEAVEEDAGDTATSDERQKIQLPENSHDRVGLIILVAVGIGALLVADNIRRRLKGEGEKATGEFRWR